MSSRGSYRQLQRLGIPGDMSGYRTLTRSPRRLPAAVDARGAHLGAAGLARHQGPGPVPGPYHLRFMKNRFSLEGQTALVTGAGRGIGRACSLALAEAGAEVWLCARTKDELEKAAEVIKAAGGAARPWPCDVTDAHAFRNLLASMRRLDVFVNNAGSNIPEPFVEVSEAHLDQLLRLNVRAAFLCAQASAQKMLHAADRKSRGGAG